MRNFFRSLYYISVGVWMTSLFITAYYGNSIPMWISLIIMDILLTLKDVVKR